MLSAPLPTSAYFWDRPCIGPANVCADSSAAQGITGPAAVANCGDTQWWFWLLAGGLALASVMKKKGRR